MIIKLRERTFTVFSMPQPMGMGLQVAKLGTLTYMHGDTDDGELMQKSDTSSLQES